MTRRTNSLRIPRPRRLRRLVTPSDATIPLVDGFDSLELLGSGGCAIVWRARRITDGARVAIKLPRGEHATRDFIERFDEECDLLRRVRPHPNVVPVLGRTRARLANDTWVPVLVMQEIPDARTLVEFADEAGLDVRGRLRLFRAVCAGVAHLHRAGVVHLDLKPSNVLVDSLGTPRVADLGAAKILLNNDARRSFFTPQYASPEQLSGAPEALEQSSDIYSLGKILATLLGGEEIVSLPRSAKSRPATPRPLASDSSGPMWDRSEAADTRVRAAIDWTPDRLLDVIDDPDPEIHGIIAKATARNPADRYADARELVAAIDERLRPWPLRVLHHATAAFRATPRGARRAGTRATVATAAVVLALAASFAGALVLLKRSLHDGTNSFAAPTMLAAAPSTVEDVFLVEIPPQCDLAELARLAGTRASVVDDLDSSAPSPSALDPSDLGTFRPVHAALVERLAQAGARVVGLDVKFPHRPELGAGTQRLASAILQASAEHQCPVVVAVSRLDARPAAELIDPQLRAVVAGWGSIELFVQAGVGRCVPMAAQLGDQEPALGFAAAVLRAALRHGAATIEPRDEALVLRGVGTSATRLHASLLAPLGALPVLSQESLPPETLVACHAFNLPARATLAAATIGAIELLGLDDAALRDRVEGRIVLVTNNLAHGDEDADRLLDGLPVLKAWDHTAALSTWLHPTAPPPSSTRVLALMAVAAALGVLVALPAVRALNRRLRQKLAEDRRASVRATALLATAGAAALVLVAAWLLVAFGGVLSFETLSITLAGFFGIVLVFAVGAGGRPVAV